MTVKEISILFQYDEWATNRTLESVSSLSESLYQSDLKSSHGGIHGTLVHIYGADWLWLERWKGNPPSALASTDEIPTLLALKTKWKEYRISLQSFLSGLIDSMLLAPLPYSDTKGNKYSEPLFQQMQHRVNHATYHRGQIVTMLRQIGAKPLGTDLITFFRTGQK